MMMNRNWNATTMLLACWAVTATGCSTLGISCYPSGSTLTTEAEEVLDCSRIPNSIARENAKTVLPPHELEPGDTVLIEPVNLDRDLRLPADQTILADGSVDLGPYGRVIVAGSDLEQAESLIEQQIAYQIQAQRNNCIAYADDEDAEKINQPALPQQCDAIAVNVRLLEPVHRFYVFGEVNAPGSYPLVGYETVLDAIVAAGGLTGSANPCKVLLARPSDPCDCRVTLPVCYREIVQMGNTATNYQLKPGDRVFVASRSCMDEIMFWRAKDPCPRCSGCNRACRDGSVSTRHPIAVNSNTMIPPGSTGWLRLSNDPLRPDDLAEDQLPTEAMELSDASDPSPSQLKDFLSPSNAGSGTGSGASGTAIDGELDFSSSR